MRGENDLACAIREFDEETNVPRESYVVLKNMRLEETFVGMNGVRYKHIYYISTLKNPDSVDLTQLFTNMQRREISGIAWKTLSEAKEYIRPHHVERANMLEQLGSILSTFETA